jgi:hypothetical protein
LARTDDFQTLLREVSLQVAAANTVKSAATGAGPHHRREVRLSRADGELRQAAAEYPKIVEGKLGSFTNRYASSIGVDSGAS